MVSTTTTKEDTQISVCFVLFPLFSFLFFFFSFARCSFLHYFPFSFSSLFYLFLFFFCPFVRREPSSLSLSGHCFSFLYFPLFLSIPLSLSLSLSLSLFSSSPPPFFFIPISPLSSSLVFPLSPTSFHRVRPGYAQKEVVFVKEALLDLGLEESSDPNHWDVLWVIRFFRG